MVNDPMKKSGLECCLDLVSTCSEGICFGIPKEWVDDLVKQKGLTLECRGGGDMTGEKSALFAHNGETLRVKLSFPGRGNVYRGDWKPDPHWRGD